MLTLCGGILAQCLIGHTMKYPWVMGLSVVDLVLVKQDVEGRDKALLVLVHRLERTQRSHDAQCERGKLGRYIVLHWDFKGLGPSFTLTFNPFILV
jgi:hypothetical protein